MLNELIKYLFYLNLAKIKYFSSFCSDKKASTHSSPVNLKSSKELILIPKQIKADIY